MRALFPLDGSERSLETLEKGLALFPKAEVTLLTVAQGGFGGAGDDRVAEFDSDEEDEIFPTVASAQRLLDRAQQVCKRRKVKATTKAVEGKVHACIVEESAGHDVLVMGALHRRGIVEKLRLGRAETIARRARCHVVLIR